MRIVSKTVFTMLSVAAGLLLPAPIVLGAADHIQHMGKTTSSAMHGSSASPAKATPAGDPYLLDKDIVSGQKIDKPVVIQFQGRELRFASQDSVKAFNATPAKYVAKIDEAMIQQQLPYYPLDKCVVSGEALGGGMGEPVNYVYKNRLVRFCCGMCKTKFDKDPAQYLAKLDEAVIAKQKAGYALDTCPISGGKLSAMGKAVDHVAGNRLVEFCCPGCLAKFNKDPLPAMTKIDAVANSDTHAATADQMTAGGGQHGHAHMH